LGFRYNPFTGTLDITGSGSGVTSNSIPASDKSISRYDGISGTEIRDSKTLVQDGGAIEAQGFITRTLITDEVTIHSNQVMISSSFSIEPSGSLVIEADAELVIV
jgi:hypothetical protein